jgi:hypothetical protein
VAPVAPVAPTGPLRSGLEGGCYGQPDAAFDKGNFAEVEVFARPGQAAWDFTLPTLDGEEVHLAGLLRTKPVVLVSGSYSCPVYRRNGAKIDQLAQRLGDQVHVVVVYGPEAHPEHDNSPYRGDNWAMPDKFSDVDLATSFEERVDHARRIGRGPGVIEAVEPLDNPFWCTYGTAPNAAYLIGMDGRFAAVHDWFDAATLVGSIEALTGVDAREGRGRKGGRRKKR